MPDNDNQQANPNRMCLELASGGGVLLREPRALHGMQLRPAQRLRALKQLAAPAAHADAGLSPGATETPRASNERR